MLAKLGGGAGRRSNRKCRLNQPGGVQPRVHVGLGERTRVGGARVRWPDGVRESFGEFEAGKTVVLERGKGSGVKAGG